jgi:hypothetical protein
VKLKGGDDVGSVSLRIDDGSVVQIAGLSSAAGMLLGPFTDASQIPRDGGSS